MRHRLPPTLLAMGFFAALGALAYVLLPPGFALRFDNIAQNLPTVREVYWQMRDGRLPLWDPYIWSGAPLLADPQSQAFYPFAWLVFALTGADHARAFDLQYAIHLALGGTFCFLYLASLGATAAGALLGAAVYALNPQFMLVGSAWTNWYTTYAWIPLILYGIERARTGSVRWLVLAGAAFAMQVFAGHPQISAYTVMLVLLYAPARAVDPTTTHRARTLFAGAVAIACGAALAAVLLLPAREMWLASQRAVPPQGSYGKISISWRGLLAVALPGLRSLPVLGPPNASTHLGLVPCLLALLALSRPDAVRVLLGLICFLGIFLTAGDYGPLGSILRHTPGLELFRGPFKFFLWIVVAVAPLAALGLSDWQRLGRNRALGWLLGAGLAACLVSVLLRPSQPRDGFLLQTGQFETQLAAGAGCVLVLIAGLYSRRARIAIPGLAVAATLTAMGIEASAYHKPNPLFQIPTVFLGGPVPQLLPLLRAPIPPLGKPGRVIWRGSLGLYHHVETADGYGGFINRQYGEALAWGQHGAWAAPDALQVLAGPNRVIDALNVRYLVLFPYRAKSLESIRGIDGAPRFRLAASFAGKLQLLENRQHLPRAYLATGVASMPDHESALAAVRTGAVDLERTPVVEEPVPTLTLGPARGHVRLLSESPARLRLRTACTRPAVLVVSDAFDSGWHAEVDSVPRRVLKANALTRAVVLPAGKHDVVMYYWPEGLTRGALISGATIVLLVALVLFV